MYKNRSALYVKYDFKAMPEACSSIMIRPWFHNFAGIIGENNYYIPTTQGIREVYYNPKKPPKDEWLESPARGWTAVIGKDKTGMVFTPEYKYLYCFYNWFGANGATSEWRFMPITIKEGKSFSTSFIIQPFIGLNKVNGAGKGIVGSISLNGKNKAVLSLISDENRNVKLKALIIENEKLPSEIISNQDAKLSVNKKIDIPIKLPEGKSNLILRCIIEDENGEFLTDFLSNIADGSKKNAFDFKPIEKRMKMPGEDFDWTFKPSFNVQTPSFKLATPYVDGKVNALFLLPINHMREMIELNQRMDLNPVYYTIINSPSYVSWLSPEEGKSIPTMRKNRLAHQNSMKGMAAEIKNAQVKVILLGDAYNPKYKSRKIPWTQYPENARKEILEKVKNGVGLVYVNPNGLAGEIEDAFKNSSVVDQNQDIVKDFPFTLFKNVKESDIKVSTLGNGKIVFLTYRAQGLIPCQAYFSMDFAYQELLYSLVIKAILWAAQTESPLMIDSIRQNGNAISIKFKKGASLCDQIMVSIWKGRHETENEFSVKTSGESDLNISIPETIPEGNHFVNLLFKDKAGKILNWFIEPINVKRKAQITDLELSDKMCTPGETETATVKVNSTIKTDVNIKVHLSCVDIHGRLLMKTTKSVKMKSGQQEIKIPFKVNHPVTMINRLTASLEYENRVLSEKTEVITFPVLGGEDNYRILLWGSYNSFPYHVYLDVLKQIKSIGFDTLTEGTVWSVDEHCNFPPYADLNLAHTNLNRIVIRSHKIIHDYQKTHNKELLKRKPCLNSPEYRKAVREKLENIAKLSHRYGAKIYMLGDEMSLTTEGGGIPFDVCFDEATLIEFRNWLKKKYDSLQKLNQIWKTNFESWDKVVPLTLEEALKQKKYISWMDHRSFMDTVYAQWFGFCDESIRKANPKAKVGESGIVPKMSVYGGYDWSKRMPFENVACFYGWGDIPISFSDRHSKILGRWALGYMSREAHQQYTMWRSLLHGQNMTACWYLKLLVQPDLELTPTGKFLKPYLEEASQGIGQLLGKSDYIYSPIAILFSQRSFQLAFLNKFSSSINTYKAFKDNIETWNQHFHDYGYTPMFISPEQIQKDILQQDKYKVLVLPYSLALSDKTVQKIEAFEAAGGIVIADIQTGLYNQYGQPRPTGALDKLFAVKRGKDSKLASATVDYLFNNNKISAGIIETQISPEGKILAKALKRKIDFGGMSIGHKGGNPANITESKYNQGSGIYLGGIRWNFAYPGGDFILSILDKNGIKPALKITNNKKQPLKVEVGHFKDGDINYYLVMWIPEQTPKMDLKAANMKDLMNIKETVNIEFPGKGLIYEIRSHRLIGKQNLVTDTLSPRIAKLYAHLQAEPVWNVNAPDTVTPGKIWNYSVSSSINGALPVYISVINPAGKKVPYLSKTIFVPSTGFKGFLPFAQNDKTGQWKIVFKNVITGKLITKTVTLKP